MVHGTHIKYTCELRTTDYDASDDEMIMYIDVCQE